MRLEALRVGLLLLSGLVLSLSAGSCGKVNENQPLFDSNTNWLVPCVADEQCSGSLRCYCGQCTKPCAQDRECSLLSNAQCAESSETLCGENASAGGLCVRGCQSDTECGDAFSCITGQCVPKPCSAGQCAPVFCGVGSARSWDDILQVVAVDLLDVEQDDQPFARYFTLGNEPDLTDPGTGLCEASLERKRQALSKLVNSLSIDPTIERPIPVDSDNRIFRIDLRDYQWDSLVLMGTATYPDAWEALVASDPYAVPFEGDDADDLAADTGTAVPILRVDSFPTAATRPELYAAMLQLPERFEQLMEEELVIAQGSEPTFQAGFVEEVEFLAQRWPLGVRSGYLLSIADVGRAPGALFERPLDEPAGEREVIFSLPNGLLAFAFAGTDGSLQPSWSVTLDPREPDGVARAPRSNWRRHASGLAVRDQVHDYVLANEGLYGSERSTILARFPGPEALRLLLNSDANTLTRIALFRAGLDPDAPEPISRVTADFESPVTAEVAASELFLTPEDLVGNLDLLDPALGALDGGSVPRSVFTTLYPSTLCILSTTLENQPSPDYCP
ncbi:MAG: Serine/threonine-protein kinase pkn1 [Pseudomonadota bacterium]|jgi:hypothetical protein